jgi:hypothetical protein
MQMPEPRRATLQPAAMSTEPQDTQPDLPPAGGQDQAIGTPPEIPAGPFAKGLAVLLPVLATMGLVFGSIVVLPRRLPQLASVIPVGPRRASGRLAEDPFDRLAARLAAERAGA